MCTFGIFCGLSFSYILMTHATAPRSARTLAQARPTMSCIHLVVLNATNCMLLIRTEVVRLQICSTYEINCSGEILKIRFTRLKPADREDLELFYIISPLFTHSVTTNNSYHIDRKEVCKTRIALHTMQELVLIFVLQTQRWVAKWLKC